MDINDILTAPTGIKRPEHPDFWKLSEIILKLKADQTEATSINQAMTSWRAAYEALGDFDSIAYCAMQAGMALHNIETGADWIRVMGDPASHESYVKSVQAYFDGFVMGAMLERSRPKASDLFGIDPDFTGDKPTDEFLEDGQGEA